MNTETIHRECNREKTDLTIIREIVEKAFDVDLRSKSRKREIADKRILYSHFAKEKTVNSFESIGNEINKNHATIMHHVRQFESLIKTDKYFRRDYMLCEKLMPNVKVFDDTPTRVLKVRLKHHHAMVYRLKKEIKKRQDHKTDTVP